MSKQVIKIGEDHVVDMLDHEYRTILGGLEESEDFLLQRLHDIHTQKEKACSQFWDSIEDRLKHLGKLDREFKNSRSASLTREPDTGDISLYTIEDFFKCVAESALDLIGEDKP